MKNARYTLLAILALAGCSSTDKVLDAKMAEETKVSNNRELRFEADQLIQNDPQLTAGQKTKLLALRQTISAQTAAIDKQELRLRSVLTEELLSPDYSIDEVNLIKKRLKKLESRRLSLLFDGIDQGAEIVGRRSTNGPSMMRALMEQRLDGTHE